MGPRLGLWAFGTEETVNGVCARLMTGCPGEADLEDSWDGFSGIRIGV